MARKIGLALGAAVLLFAVSSCGKAAEKLTEKAIEEGTGCENVDINQDGGSVECDGQSIDVGGNAEIPSDFPSELAPPDDAKIYAVYTTTDDAGLKTWTITASLQGAAQDVYDGLTTQLTEADYTITDDSFTEGSNGVGGQVTARNDTYEVTAAFGENTTGTDDGGVYITMTVRELSAEEAAETTTTGDDSSPTSESGGGGGETSSNAELPDGYPASLEPPAGATIENATKNTSNGQVSFLVYATTDGTVADVYDEIKQQLLDNDFDVTTDSLTDTGGVSYGTLVASDAEWDASITVTNDASGTSGGDVVLAYTISAAA